MKRWNWIEDLVLPPAVAVLHTAWLSLWVLWSVRALPPELAEPALPAWLLAGLFLAAAALTRWSLARHSLELTRRLVLAVGLVAVFAGLWFIYRFPHALAFVRALVEWGMFISPVFVGLAAAAFMWWRGIVLGRSSLPQENLERAFYGGIVALVVMYAANQLRPLVTPEEALAAALAFFATGLSALALVSVENARRYHASLTGTWLALNRYWLGTVASVIGAILLAGLLVAGLLSPATFTRLSAGLQQVMNWITIAIVVFLGTLVFLAAWITTPVLEALGNALGENPFRFPRFPPPQELEQTALDFLNNNPWFVGARQALTLLAIGVVVGLLFWWAVRRFRRREADDADEQRENIATRELIWQQLRQLFRRRPRAGPPPPPYLALRGPRDDPRLIVRRAYQSVLEWALTASLPRAAGQTPAAYADVLAQAAPQEQEAIGVLTGAYLLARYAKDGPSLEQARRAEGAAARLKAARPAAGPAQAARQD